jgi:hypothetical protein
MEPIWPSSVKSVYRKEKTMLKFRMFLIHGLVIAIALMLALPPIAGAQTSKEAESAVVKDTAQKARGGGAEDPNIKSGAAQNNPDPAAGPKAPPDKGGEKARGGCNLVVDNFTPWIIKLYVSGIYVGTVSAWGKASGYQSLSDLILYAVADFTDGSQKTWGPRVASCSGSYTWGLYP